MARQKTTKAVAKRVDFSYLNQPQPFRRTRNLLIWLSILGALGWFAYAGVTYRGAPRPHVSGLILNPGPVSDAHAYFEHQCTRCHSGQPGERFGRDVTDAACLVCHDGSIHHSNQKLAQNAAQVSRESRTLGLVDPNHPGDAVSADCVTCHTEHRGRPALAATSDAHCVVCHRDLGTASHRQPAVQMSVTAFNSTSHPKFGRRLLKDGNWFDPTVLKFNHLAHKEKDTEKLLIGADGELNCVLCHSTEAPQSLTMVDRGKQPPYPVEADRSLSAANSSDRRYMQPIRYDRHCAGCHGQDLKLPQTVGKIKVGRRDANVDTRLGGDVLPHRELPLIRELIAARLGTVAGKTQFGANITRQQWLSENFKSFARLIEPRLSTELSGVYKEKTIEAPEVTSEAATQPAAGIDSLLIDYYEAAVAFDVCGKCHSVEGDLPSPKSDATREALRTGPTRLSDSPRRWFAASQFDHDAHRAVRCIDCHSQALKSQNTSDVLMPDMTTRTSTAGSSCIDCHNSDPAPNRAAPAGCVTCHLYHDRTHDRSPDGPTTQPTPRTIAAAK